MIPTRRLVVLGLIGLPGCSALGALNQATQPRDTFELQPVNIASQAARSSRTLLVLVPTAPAAIATDRLLIREDPLSVTYLPDARWSDAMPQMMQSVLVQSLASSGRIGFVGAQGAGPVPDAVLLTRVDVFEVSAQTGSGFQARMSFELTVLRDRDQRVLGTRRFDLAQPVANDEAATIARAFQQLLDALLPDAVAWVLSRALV